MEATAGAGCRGQMMGGHLLVRLRTQTPGVQTDLCPTLAPPWLRIQARVWRGPSPSHCSAGKNERDS